MEEYKPVGMFIVQNEKGQYIYDCPFIKGGYLISKSDYKKYRVYASRYIIGIVVATLLSTFVNIVPSVLVGLMTALSGEVLFRVKFLKNQCVYLGDFVRPNDSGFFATITSKTTKPKKLIKSLLFVALAVLLVLNSYMQNYAQYIIIACWIIGVVCVFMSFLYLVAFFKDGGNK